MLNKLYELNLEEMTATLIDKKLGKCKLEFIINDNCGKEKFIEPYVLKHKENDEFVYTELLDTDIQPVNLYESLSLLTLHHMSK